MSKSKFLLLSTSLILISYVCLLFLKIKDISFHNLWFSLLIFCIALYALIYAFFYKLDSCTYYGVLLLCFSLAITYRFVSGINFAIFYPAYIFCFAFAHLSVFVLFQQNIHFKLFAFLILEVILLTSYKMQFINFWLLFAINGSLLTLFAINYFYRLRKNLRRE